MAQDVKTNTLFNESENLGVKINFSQDLMIPFIKDKTPESYDEIFSLYFEGDTHNNQFSFKKPLTIKKDKIREIARNLKLPINGETVTEGLSEKIINQLKETTAYQLDDATLETINNNIISKFEKHNISDPALIAYSIVATVQYSDEAKLAKNLPNFTFETLTSIVSRSASHNDNMNFSISSSNNDCNLPGYEARDSGTDTYIEIRDNAVYICETQKGKLLNFSQGTDSGEVKNQTSAMMVNKFKIEIDNNKEDKYKISTSPSENFLTFSTQLESGSKLDIGHFSKIESQSEIHYKDDRSRAFFLLHQLLKNEKFLHEVQKGGQRYLVNGVQQEEEFVDIFSDAKSKEFYNKVKTISIEHIVDYVLANPAAAKIFFQKRGIGHATFNGRNFRKEIAENSELMKKMIDSEHNKSNESFIGTVESLRRSSHVNREILEDNLAVKKEPTHSTSVRAPKRFSILPKEDQKAILDVLFEKAITDESYDPFENNTWFSTEKLCLLNYEAVTDISIEKLVDYIIDIKHPHLIKIFLQENTPEYVRLVGRDFRSELINAPGLLEKFWEKGQGFKDASRDAVVSEPTLLNRFAAFEVNSTIEQVNQASDANTKIQILEKKINNVNHSGKKKLLVCQEQYLLHKKIVDVIQAQGDKNPFAMRIWRCHQFLLENKSKLKSQPDYKKYLDEAESIQQELKKQESTENTASESAPQIPNILKNIWATFSVQALSDIVFGYIDKVKGNRAAVAASKETCITLIKTINNHALKQELEKCLNTYPGEFPKEKDMQDFVNKINLILKDGREINKNVFLKVANSYISNGMFKNINILNEGHPAKETLEKVSAKTHLDNPVVLNNSHEYDRQSMRSAY